MKNVLVIIVGITIDVFQTFFMLALAVIGFTVTSAVGWIPIIGQAVAGGVDLGGAVLGATVDFCISATFGTGFIFLLMMNGLLSAKDLLSIRRLPLIVSELVPFFSVLPTYTALAIVCVLKKVAQEKLARTASPAENEEVADMEATRENISYEATA